MKSPPLRVSLTSQQFGEDTAVAPHIDGHGVFGAEDHFRRAVKPRLNVRVNALMLITRRTEVDHLTREEAGTRHGKGEENWGRGEGKQGKGEGKGEREAGRRQGKEGREWEEGQGMI